jgi:histidinol-phosphate aminotransferase
MRTYSKVGLAALRLGVLVGAPALVEPVEKIRPPYNLGLLPQLAGALALGQFREALTAHVAEVVAERGRLHAAMQKIPGVEVFDSAANLLLFRVADAPALHARLLERSILVRNLHRPDRTGHPLAHCLRVTVGTPPENDRFLAALADALKSTR